MAVKVGERVFICVDAINSSMLIKHVSRDQVLANYFDELLSQLDEWFREHIEGNGFAGELINRTGDGAIYAVECADSVSSEQFSAVMSFCSRVLGASSSLIELAIPRGEESVTEDFDVFIAVSYGELYELEKVEGEYFGRAINEASKVSGSRGSNNINSKNIAAAETFYNRLTDSDKKCFSCEDMEGSYRFYYVTDDCYRKHA